MDGLPDLGATKETKHELNSKCGGRHIAIIYTLEEIRNIVVPIAERYGLSAVYLFGSYARRKATEKSDIDLLIDTSGTSISSLFSLGGVYCELQEALGKRIDLITVSSLEQESRMPSEDEFRERIRNERINIYNAT